MRKSQRMLRLFFMNFHERSKGSFSLLSMDFNLSFPSFIYNSKPSERFHQDLKFLYSHLIFFSKPSERFTKIIFPQLTN